MPQMVKNLPSIQATRVKSLGQEDPLEKEIAAHSISLPGEFMDKGAWQATVHVVAKSQTLTPSLSFMCITF